MSDWVFVAEAASIKPGHYETVDLDGTLAAVFNVNGEFYAIEDVCTHDGTVLTSGNPIEGDEIVCPRDWACRISARTVLTAVGRRSALRRETCKVDKG